MPAVVRAARPLQRAGLVRHPGLPRAELRDLDGAGGLGAFALLLAKRLGERRVEVLTDVTALDVVMSGAASDARPVGSARPRAIGRGPRRRGDRPASAARPRVVRRAQHAGRAPHRHPPGAARRRPGPAGRGVVYEEYTLTVRTGGQAPPGCSRLDGDRARTALGGPGARAGTPQARRPRRRRGPPRPVAARPRRAVVRLPLGGAVAGPQHHPRPALHAHPPARVYAAGAHTGGGGGCRSWGSAPPWWPRPSARPEGPTLTGELDQGQETGSARSA